MIQSPKTTEKPQGPLSHTSSQLKSLRTCKTNSPMHSNTLRRQIHKTAAYTSLPLQQTYNVKEQKNHGAGNTAIRTLISEVGRLRQDAADRDREHNETAATGQGISRKMIPKLARRPAGRTRRLVEVAHFCHWRPSGRCYAPHGRGSQTPPWRLPRRPTRHA